MEHATYICRSIGDTLEVHRSACSRCLRCLMIFVAWYNPRVCWAPPFLLCYLTYSNKTREMPSCKPPLGRQYKKKKKDYKATFLGFDTKSEKKERLKLQRTLWSRTHCENFRGVTGFGWHCRDKKSNLVFFMLKESGIVAAILLRLCSDKKRSV